MAGPSASAAIAVRRARVTGWHATRDDAERWLGAVPVADLGLDADEILYIPRLRLRVPTIGGGSASRMPDRILAELRVLLAAADQGWDHGFATDRPRRFSTRPRFGAWLIALWLKDGSAAARAAFTAATGEPSLARWQRRTLLPDGALLVATIARLADIGLAARWIARLEPGDLVTASHALDTRFGIASPNPAISETPRSSRRSEDPASATTDLMPDIASCLVECASWLEEHGNDVDGLPPAALSLLLTTLAIARRPASAVARPEALAAHVAAIVARADPADVTGPGRPSVRTVLPAPSRPASSAPSRSPARVRAGDRTDAPMAHGSSRPHSDSVPAVSEPASPPSPVPDHDPHRDTLPSPAIHRGEPVRSKSVSVPFLVPDARFSTGYGGLLFLLNAFTALGLYPDFTEPRGKRLAPSPLWLADRIGRYWFGAAYRRDPLSVWIGAHGERGDLPSPWQVPKDWLAGLDGGMAPRLTRRPGTVTAWHAAGFPLFDGAERDLPRALRRCRLVRRAPARLPATQRWPACLALYLDARLDRVAGAGLALLAQPARIVVRDLDLRAAFSLDRHPVELRLAGLDRNPGWCPAEGRSIAFGFE